MDLIKCPRCGEQYSSSYRRCPFCEEEDYPRKAAGKPGGHHVSEKRHTHSARGPMAAVLIVVLAVLSWYLFGGKFMEKLQEDDGDAAEVVTPVTPTTPNDEAAAPDDTTDDTSDTNDNPAPPVVEEEPKSAEPDIAGGESTPAESVTVDASQLTMKTNVGTLSKDAGTGKYDCTVKTSESIRLILQGTDAAVTWSSADTSVLTVSADGALKPVKAGTTTVTASVGGAAVECIVRVK